MKTNIIKLLTLLCFFTVFAVNGYSAIPKKVKVSSNDSTAGFLNGKLVAGSNISFTEGNDGQNEILTISATGGGSGTLTTIKESTVQVGDTDIGTLDFGFGFDLIESPDAEINITLDLSEVVTGDVTYTGNVANVTEADALAANGANCSAGSYPLGVDTVGAVESCTDATTEIDSVVATHAGLASVHHTATVNTNANTICTGTGNYLDGEGNCDPLITNTDSQNLFETISTTSGTAPVADTATDTLTLTAGTGMTITGNSITDTIIIATTVVDTILDLSGVETITGNWVNTDNPWAANEITEADPNVDTEAEIEAITGALFGASKVVTAGNIWVADGTDFESVVMSGDIVIASGGATTIQANAVTLTTDTTGNYVDDVTASQGLLLTGTEGATIGFQDCAANEILKRNSGDTAWECSTDSTGGSPTFTDITTGTNTTATMTVGTGSSLTISGSGTINATTGDTATSFFSAGTIEHERGGLESDVSSFNGLVGITGGTTFNQTGTTTQIIIFDGAGAPTSAALSGDATMTNAGVVTVVDDSHNHVITNIDAFTETQLETQLSDVTNVIVSTEIDTFSELDTLIADKALVNKADGAVWLGVHDFGGATSLEIVNAAAPTTDATGEIALDTTITDHQPLLQYFDGGENMTVIAIDTSQLPALDNEIISYDAATDKFILEAPAGGASEWTLASGVLAPNTSATTDVVIGGTTAANSDIVLLQTGEAVFNEQGNDVDFRIEGDTEPNLFVVDAGGEFVEISGTQNQGKIFSVIYTLSGSPTANKFLMDYRIKMDNTATHTSVIDAFHVGLSSTVGTLGSNNNRVAGFNVDITPDMTGTWSNTYAFRANSSLTAGTIGNMYGMYVSLNAGSGTISTAYGLRIDSLDANTNFSILSDVGHNIFNNDGEDYDFRVETLNNPNAFIINGGRDSVEIDAKRVDIPDDRTITDSGDGNPATLTLEPLSSHIAITCNDADTCDITMSETNAINGQVVKIFNLSTNVVDMADTSGVSEIAGAFAMGQFDSITLEYVVNTWIETSRSDN